MTQPVKTWSPKDPNAVLDYVYRIPLDATDSIASGQVSVTKLSGTATIDSFSLAAAPNNVDGQYGQDVTVWLSGGTDGETALFQIAWSTVGTRHDDALVQLPIISAELPVLALTGYAKPVAGHLMARYPAFADVDASTVQYWLTDAERSVTSSWSEGDYAAGLMALAAHNMALAGYGNAASQALGEIPVGVSRFRSGSLDVSFTTEAANARMSGGLDSTIYGAEYRTLFARNFGGPIVQPTGVPDYGEVNRLGYPW